MADSNHNITRSELVTEALAMLGVSDPSNDEISKAVRKLNSMLKYIDIKGRWLWTIDNTETSLTLVVGQAEYSAGALATQIASDILELEYCAVLENSNDRMPLTIIRKTESMYTSLKDDSGEPIRVFLEKAPLEANNKLIFFPVPNVAFDVVYTYRRRINDMDLVSDNPDAPAHWQLPLQYFLAYHMAPAYGLPLQERLTLKAEAEEMLGELKFHNLGKATSRPLRTQFF